MGESFSADLTSTEIRFLDTRLRRVRNLEAMALGNYAEAVVAEALAAEESVGGIDRVDMTVNGMTIEVKCTSGTKWGCAPTYMREDGVRVRRRRADVYVLAHHEGTDHRVGWTFYVVSRAALDEHGKNQVTLGRLRRWGIGPVDSAGLAAAVAAIKRGRVHT